MGLLRHNHPDGPGGRRLVMREKALSIGDDSWIEDESGNKVMKVNGKAMRVREAFVLEDAQGNELLHLQARDLRLRGVMKIDRDGDTIATVTKKVIGIRDRFGVDVEDVEDLEAIGNVVDHEFKISRDDSDIAVINKTWVRARETYGIELGADEDVAFLVAVIVAIEALAR